LYRKMKALLLSLVLGGVLIVPVISAPAASATHPTVSNETTCTVLVLNTGKKLTNGDHINGEIRQNGRVFQVNAYVDLNLGGYSNLGVRVKVDGVDKDPYPLTEAEVKSGKLTFRYAEWLTGSWEVVWVQFNNTYFNQDRDDKAELECDPPAKPASAEIEILPATCEVGETLRWGAISNAVFSGTPDGTVGPASYNVVATANNGHKFTGDVDIKTFTGNLAGPGGEDCLPPGNTGWIDETTPGQWWLMIVGLLAIAGLTAFGLRKVRQ
jgi:hypothetical protein